MYHLVECRMLLWEGQHILAPSTTIKFATLRRCDSRGVYPRNNVRCWHSVQPEIEDAIDRNDVACFSARADPSWHPVLLKS